MPQGSDYIFFLQDKARHFWGLDSNGNVILNANPYPLEFSPDGWDKITIKNVRNLKYWGVDRTVSAPLKFVEDGAKILKHISYVLGDTASVYLVICENRLDYTAGVEYGFWYKQVFRSEIDLSSFDHDGSVVNVSMLEEGLAKHLKANESEVYELDPDIYVKNDGIVVHEKHNFITQTGLYADSLLGIIFTTKEGFAYGAASFSIYKQTFPGDLTTSNEYFFITAIAITGIRISGSINVSANTGTLNLRLRSSTGQNIILASTSSTGILTFDQTFDGAADERFFLYADMSVLDLCTIQETDISVEFDSRYKTTYIPAKRPQTIFTDLINKMTGGEYQAEDCPYLGELQNWDRVLTSGDAIRGVENAKIKISFAQFFDFWNTYDEVGIREKGKTVLLDRKAALTDNTNVIDLGTVSKPRVKYNKSFPFNQLSVGWPDVKNENGFVNGKNEVNTTFLFGSGTTISPRKYEKTCKIKVSCYDIENIRIEGYKKDSTDNRSDNDIYAMHIADTLIAGSGDIPDHYELDRSYNTYVIGVDQSSSVYNLEFSPKNCIIRSGDFFRSCFYKGDNIKFYFRTADRNKDMAYINGSDVRVESADFAIGQLAAPFFNNRVLEVDVDVPENMLDELDNNPAAGFQFTFEGQVYKGINMENSVNPKTNAKQTFQLLNHPDNDLSKLVDYYG